MHLLFMIAMLLQGCSQPVVKDDSQVISNCIPPLITFAFPINQSPYTPLPDQIIMPLSPWQMISELPAQENGSVRITNRIMLAHSVNGNPGIWVIRDLDKGQGDLRSSLLIYNTSTKQWHELSGVFDNISSAVNNIYEKQGTLWVVSRWADRVFGVFDESTLKFKRLDIVEPIPEGYVYFDKRQGEFWIFEKFQAVYSLNPKTSTLVKRLETPNVDFFYNSVALAPDGSIYILDSLGHDSSRKNDFQILKFSPQNNELETIYNPLFDLTPRIICFVGASLPTVDKKTVLGHPESWLREDRAGTPCGTQVAATKSLRSSFTWVLLTRNLFVTLADPSQQLGNGSGQGEVLIDHEAVVLT